tara:strand:+ start:2674 stop:2901 length:228 start_codon:yes stop_codon:yes gene_type:complete
MPGYLPTSKRIPGDNVDTSRNGQLPGVKVFSLRHEVEKTIYEKWVAEQWIWLFSYNYSKKNIDKMVLEPLLDVKL